MKTRKLIRKYFMAIFSGDKKRQTKLYNKILRKSLKGKNTLPIK